MTGLKSLEYRGYDSSGIAYLDKNNNIKIYKKVGQIKNLDQILNYEDEASLGISHTRWATHGGVTDTNAHPHNQGKITLVHNGIIENYEEIKKELEKEGYNFKSSTDSEVAAALIDKLYKENKDMLKTLVILKDKLKGSYAFNIINSDIPNKIYGIRKDVPLIVGVSDHGNMFASDIPAILHVTNKYIVLNNNEIVELEQDNVKYYNSEGKEITKEVKEYAGTIDSISYEHFMLKEINEESEVVKNILNLYTKNNKIKDIYNIKKYKNIDIVACGSASFAGQIGKYYIEKYANIKTDVYYASEYRYQKNFFTKDTLVILISQSGETADTLAALKLAKENGINTLAIVNRRDSSIAREADSVIYTEAGIEVAVATTKAYLAQVLILLLLAFKDNNKETKLLEDLKLLPNLITKYINEYDYSNIANILKDKEHIFYLGRGIDYYLSMEGSLKLKEISYIHSEAFQAGELKHGSISLIDKDFGVVSVVTDKTISDKTISNLKEVSARGAKIITITNIKDNNFADYTILVEDYDEILNPLLVIVPMQMLAYNVAKLRDCDIDKPRNLAKSVTVE
jgi:glucosamine--fructose-6-phosphate aminotransferase (isomerizing)